MHRSPKQKVIIAPLPAALPIPTRTKAKPARVRTESEMLRLDAMIVDGNVVLATVQAYISKLQAYKVELETTV
jgi:hypothetical protein